MKRTLFLSLLCALLVGCVSTPAESLIVETPDQAIKALQDGNARYVAEKMQSPNGDKARRAETLDSQHPYAAIVACSDSRVPVELLFDQGIGDLFVIRTAGNSVASDLVMGSVDYAIDHLDVPLVVILGHQHCGGVTSAIADHHSGHHNGKIGELLATLQQDVEPFIGDIDRVDEAIMVNAEAQVDRLLGVDYIKEKVSRGDLKIVKAYYNLESGEVIF